MLQQKRGIKDGSRGKKCERKDYYNNNGRRLIKRRTEMFCGCLHYMILYHMYIAQYFALEELYCSSVERNQLKSSKDG